MEDLYQEIILDHYRNPQGRGLREPFEAQVHHVNPTCGDEIDLRLHLEERDGVLTVADVSYDGQGCSISQASASVMYENVNGLPLADAMFALDRFSVPKNTMVINHYFHPIEITRNALRCSQCSDDSSPIRVPAV